MSRMTPSTIKGLQIVCISLVFWMLCFKLRSVQQWPLDWIPQNSFLFSVWCIQLEWIVALLPWCSSVCLSGMGVHTSTDLSLWLDSPLFWAPWHQSMSTYSQLSFSSSTCKRGGVWINANWAWYFKNGWKETLSYYWVLIESHICRVDWHNIE